MSLTLAEVFKELEISRQERAVWSEVVEFLSKFIDSEIRESDQAIVAEGCVSKHVPQETILNIIEEIEQEKINPLADSIELMENYKVLEETEDGDNEDDGNARKKSVKRKSGKQKTYANRGTKAKKKKKLKAVRIIATKARNTN